MSAPIPSPEKPPADAVPGYLRERLQRLDEESLRVRNEAAEARSNLGQTTSMLAQTWQQLLRTKGGLAEDHELRRVTLNLLEDTEHARRSEQEQIVERQASEERYRMLFNLMDQAYGVGEVIFNDQNAAVDFRWLEVNPQFEPITGLSRDLVLSGQTMRQLCPELEPEWSQIYGTVAITGEPVRFEKWCAALGRWFDIYAFRISEPEQHRVAVLCNNITQRKHAEEALERSLQEARQARHEMELAIRAKDRFLAVLSHELRTPLMPVLMIAGALAHDESLSEEVREDLAMIRRNIEIETRLIDDLLDMNRLAVGKFTLKLTTVDLNTMVREACAICHPLSQERDQQLAFKPAPEAGSLSADPVRLQQAIWNVLRNAIKFTSKNGRVEVITLRRNDRCEVQVHDNGIGIREDILPTIFQAFEQGEETVTRRYGGLGLGLAITKGIVELHGGLIHATSKGTDQGASFTLEFPAL